MKLTVKFSWGEWSVVHFGESFMCDTVALPCIMLLEVWFTSTIGLLLLEKSCCHFHTSALNVVAPAQFRIASPNLFAKSRKGPLQALYGGCTLSSRWEWPFLFQHLGVKTSDRVSYTRKVMAYAATSVSASSHLPRTHDKESRATRYSRGV